MTGHVLPHGLRRCIRILFAAALLCVAAQASKAQGMGDRCWQIASMRPIYERGIEYCRNAKPHCRSRDESDMADLYPEATWHYGAAIVAQLPVRCIPSSVVWFYWARDCPEVLPIGDQMVALGLAKRAECTNGTLPPYDLEERWKKAFPNDPLPGTAPNPPSCRPSDFKDLCDMYRCRDQHANGGQGCGAAGYYQGYGRKYCEVFTNSRPDYSSEGREWSECTMKCLADHLHDNVPLDASCEAAGEEAFESHVDCYVDCGVCELPADDWFNILDDVGSDVFASPGQGLSTAAICYARRASVSGGPNYVPAPR